VPVLGAAADRLCLDKGITDSRAYLAEAIKTLPGGWRVVHVSVSIEAARPKLMPHFAAMRASIAGICSLGVEDVAITATTGEGLTAFGRGEGIQVFSIVTAEREACA
jgi:2-C-methyl-D-erythritol 2,4-cyclodiphosphate synthase